MHSVRLLIGLTILLSTQAVFAAEETLGVSCRSESFGTADSMGSTDYLLEIGDVRAFMAPPVRGTARPLPFDTIVFHDPGSNNCDPIAAMRYGHTYDPKRDGYFGYHFYIGQDGTIYQAASLSRRTNHVKPRGPLRNPEVPRSNSSAIGITLVCGHKKIPDTQLDAAVRLGHALQVSYTISSRRVFGHGELQTDRSASEGIVAARATRNTPPLSGMSVVYNKGDNSRTICTISGSVPRSCASQSQCELFDVVSRLSKDAPISDNIGYTLPTAKSGILTDAQEAGYTGISGVGNEKSIYFHPDFTDPLHGVLAPILNSTRPVSPKKPIQPVSAPKNADKQCGGYSYQDLRKKFDRGVSIYKETYKGQLSWDKILTQKRTDRNAAAIEYAKKLQSIHRTLNTCK